MSAFSNQTGSGESAIDPSAIADRSCLACGYNLRGLGDEPRCPECGLAHIPAQFRKQVWELVDSGKWFFSGFFSPIRRRLPGWWWALDRKGDVKRSFHHVARNVMLAVTVIFVTTGVFDAFVIERTMFVSGTDFNGNTVSIVTGREHRGLFRLHVDDPWHYQLPPLTTYSMTTATQIRFAPSYTFFGPASKILLVSFLIWMCPTCIGLWTQIRRGLPAFAKAPRTILAAANLESHRLVYHAILAGVWMLFELNLRWRFANNPTMYHVNLAASAVGIYVIAALGWVGPLRSDYTSQLIRSRRHGIRIMIMYALFGPPLISLAAVCAYDLVFHW